MFGLFGCKNKDKNAVRFKVDYDGQKDCFENAKDEYEPGEEVELYYGLIATDTDYSFFLDGERINYLYEDGKGFVIRFTMPDHDVKLVCEHRNSMIYIPPTEPDGSGVMLIDFYRGTVATVGGGHYIEITVESLSGDEVTLTEYRMENGDEEFSKYIVPYSVVDECREMIDLFGMRDWKDLSDPVSLDGAKMSCGFMDGDSYTEVTSEKMPKNGKEAFSAVESVLYKYVDDKYLVTD